ncbi:MAG: hypothetical protein H7201_04890 [Candidatus Saccharibacteria bacterium]|nr:hypothetical protein [Microbacteriaceae bacterium]
MRSALDPQAKLAVVLRGSLPALRVFALVMSTASIKNPSIIGLAMARASLVAQELATCWTEAWDHHRTRQILSAPTEVPAVSSHLITVPLTPETSAPPVVETTLDLVAQSPSLDDIETTMLTLAAYGLSNEEIARKMSYSKQAVVWHLSRLMKAWKAPNRTALVSLAFVRGVIRSRLTCGDRADRRRAHTVTGAWPAPPGQSETSGRRVGRPE